MKKITRLIIVFAVLLVLSRLAFASSSSTSNGITINADISESRLPCNEFAGAFGIEINADINATGVSCGASGLNTAPSQNKPLINSTFGTNLTDENLTCYASATDIDGYNLTYEGYWYKNGVQNTSFNTSPTNYTPGTLVNVSTLDSSQTLAGENWSCEVRAYDGENYSSYNTSNNLTVLAQAGLEQTTLTLDKSDSQDPVYNGTNLNYTITISVSGNNATNTTVRELYDLNVTFVSASPSATSGNDTWELGNLTSGTYTINITVLVNSSVANGTNLTNYANITYYNATGSQFFNETNETTEVQVAAVTKGIIPVGSGSPFYTNKSSNPFSITLNKGESQLVTFWVNANGSVGTSLGFFGYANRTSNMSHSDITSTVNVTIQQGPNNPPIQGIPILNSTYGTNYTTENLTCYANATDIDGDNITYTGEWYRNGSVFVGEYWNVSYDSGGTDKAYDVAVDSSGNIYVTGHSYSGGAGDFYTIKYNSTGGHVWNVSYNGGSSSDTAEGIAVDSSGNVYITGYSGAVLIHTIKYDSSGNQVWNVNDSGYGHDIAVDSSGNVYVTGSSGDYYTIKYNSTGGHVWNTSYDGGNNDEAQGIAVDSSGNVYVTGWSNNGSVDNYYTIKYNSSGNETWNASYDSGDRDRAQDIFVDSSGNVYVTGYSGTFGMDYDYYTIKYDSSGNEIWNASYDSGSLAQAYSIAVDSAGNVYVTGDSVGGIAGDYYTIKYNSSGNHIWNRSYDSGNDDKAYGVSVDSSGNVYVTGYSDNGIDEDYYIIKYKNGFIKENQTEGNLVNVGTLENQFTSIGDNWACKVQAYDGENYSQHNTSSNLTVLGPNNPPTQGIPVLNSTYGTNYTTENLTCYANATDIDGDNITYSGEWYLNNSVFLSEDWNATYDRFNDEDDASDMIVDSSGNVYVVGFAEDSTGDWLVVKYNSTGDEQWNVTYDSSYSLDDAASGITLDDAEDVYVTGRLYNETGSGYLESATFKYDKDDGTQLLSMVESGVDHTYGTDVAVDISGNIFVTGYTKNASGNFILTLFKYNSAGNEQWNVTYPTDYNSYGQAVKLDDNGNIYVAGYWTVIGNTDFLLIKYNSAGGIVWDKKINFTVTDYGKDMDIDSHGNLYMGGYIDSQFGTGNDYLTLKLDSSGNEIWNVSVNPSGVGSSNDALNAVVVDNFDNVYVTGYSYAWSSSTNRNYYTIKYDSQGNEIWNHEYDTGNNIDLAFGIAVDDDYFYVTGNSGSGTSKDILTLKYKNGFIKRNQTEGILTNISTLDSSFTSAGDNWSCEVRAYDGEDYSGYIMSNNLTVLAAAPTISIQLVDPPTDTNFIHNKFNTFTVNVSCGPEVDCGDINVTLDPRIKND